LAFREFTGDSVSIKSLNRDLLAAALIFICGQASSEPISTARPPHVTQAAAESRLPPTGDCGKIDAAAAAVILGVGRVRATPNYGHSKLPPDNTDLLACSYFEVSPLPRVPTLKYLIYTPIAADIEAVYSSLLTQKHPTMQPFAPNVGQASAGWFGPGPQGGESEAHVIFRTGTNVFSIQVSGLSSADAARTAALKAAAKL